MAEKKFDVGLETTEYTPKKKGDMTLAEKYRIIYQIVQDATRSNPSYGIHVSMVGDLLQVKCMTAEVSAPIRIREIEVNAKKMIDEAVKLIKKEFKSVAKTKLDLSEKKDLANNTIQKVSLNERYYCTFWRMFEIS